MTAMTLLPMAHTEALPEVHPMPRHVITGTMVITQTDQIIATDHTTTVINSATSEETTGEITDNQMLTVTETREVVRTDMGRDVLPETTTIKICVDVAVGAAIGDVEVPSVGRMSTLGENPLLSNRKLS